MSCNHINMVVPMHVMHRLAANVLDTKCLEKAEATVYHAEYPLNEVADIYFRILKIGIHQVMYMQHTQAPSSS